MMKFLCLKSFKTYHLQYKFLNMPFKLSPNLAPTYISGFVYAELLYLKKKKMLESPSSPTSAFVSGTPPV